ncbi:MAG: hypothetical protein ABL886_13390 [Rhodoglobus sp.]
MKACILWLVAVAACSATPPPDRDAVFVIRALVPPGGSIKGWLETFFDLPFGNRVQTARRRGPNSGPC